MDLEKKYYDSDGNECNILELVKKEPEWAANVLQYHEQQSQKFKQAILWALGECGNFPHRKKNDGAYHWRTELRKLSGL